MNDLRASFFKSASTVGLDNGNSTNASGKVDVEENELTALSRAVTCFSMAARSSSTCTISRLSRLKANPKVARVTRKRVEEKTRTIFNEGEWVFQLDGD